MLNHNSIVPLHQQLEELIRKKIDSGEWTTGMLIPSENELTRTCGISRMTVRGAITKLVQEDYLVRIPGKGTYVASPKIPAKSLHFAGIREQLEQMGYEVQTRLLSVEKSEAGEKIGKSMNLKPGDGIYTIQRLRLVKGEPLSIHTSCVPDVRCPNIERLDLVQEQLCDILEHNYGLKADHTREALEITSARKEEAELLNVKAKSPLLLLESTLSDDKGCIFEFSRVVFRSDKIKLVFEY